MYSWRVVLGSPRTRYWQLQCLVRVHFLVHRELFVAVNSHGRRDKVLAKASFVRTVIMLWSPSSYSLLHDRAIIERQVVGTRNSNLIHKTNRHIANMTKNKCVCMLSRCSCVQLFATLWTVAHQAPLSMGFSRQDNTGVGCYGFLQGIFPTRRSNQHLLYLCIGRHVLYSWHH